MPLIRIEYDESQVSDNEARAVSEAVQGIVSNVTTIKDVFVYANSSKVRVKVAPIEIFIEMSASKIENKERLASNFKDEIINWKKSTGFQQPINLTLIPMDWVVEINI